MRVLHCITTLNVGGAQIMLQRYLEAVLDRPDGHAPAEPRDENAPAIPRDGHAPAGSRDEHAPADPQDEHAPAGSRDEHAPADPQDEHIVVSLTCLGPIGRDLAARGVRVIPLGQAAGRPSVRTLARLRRVIRAERPDVVHGWMYHANLALSLAALPGPRVPVIWGVHHSLGDIGREPPLTRLVIRAGALLSGRTAAITYCSQVSADQHEGAGFDPAPRMVLPNGIDTRSFRPDPDAAARVRAMLAVPPERFLIGSIARAHPMKAQGAIVRAAAALLKRGRDVHVLLVGEGQTAGPAAQAARALGIADRVALLESRRDIDAIVPGLDLFVLSSAWGEAFSVAAGEAMASGVPTVVTDLGDCALLVGETGRVVPPGDDAALADAIEAMIALGGAGRGALGARARERIERNYSLDVYRRRLDGLLRRVAA